MPCRLILNADDFGLTAGINRAVEELHQASSLTSATLMATGPAFLDAVTIARRNPGLGVGCHVVLVDGMPVSPPETIPSLLGPDRRTFRPTLLDFIQAALRGAINPGELHREVLAQVQRLQDAGLPVTHLDSHKHTHLIPPVTRALLRVCAECGIPAIRNPFEPAAALALGHGSSLRRFQIRLLDRIFHARFLAAVRASPTRTTDGSLAVSTTGDLTQETLAELLSALPERGIWELITHPGYSDAALNGIATRLRASRDTEREALLACLPAFRANPASPDLIHYGAL